MTTQGRRAMSLSWRRVRAIVRKELREYRRNRLDRRDDGDPPAGLHHPAAGRRSSASRRGPPVRSAHEHVLLYLLGIPILVPVDPRGHVDRRRATAGHPRAGPHDADPARGVPARQGAGGPRPVDRVAYAVYALFLAWSASLPNRASHPRSSRGPTCSPSCCSRRCSPALVDLGRHRDLDTVERRPGRPAARPAREPAAGPPRRARGARRHPPHPRARSSPSGWRSSSSTWQAGGSCRCSSIASA